MTDDEEAYRRESVRALIAHVRKLCEPKGIEPSEAVVMLLTAAVKVTMDRTDKPLDQVATKLAGALGTSINIVTSGFLDDDAPGKSELH